MHALIDSYPSGLLNLHWGNPMNTPLKMHSKQQSLHRLKALKINWTHVGIKVNNRQITSNSTVCETVCSSLRQRNITVPRHWPPFMWLMDSPHKRPVVRKVYPRVDVIMFEGAWCRRSSTKDAISMMTSSNGNIFRVTGPLCGEFTGHRWIPRTKASDSELWCFFHRRLNKRLSKQSWG